MFPFNLIFTPQNLVRDRITCRDLGCNGQGDVDCPIHPVNRAVQSDPEEAVSNVGNGSVLSVLGTPTQCQWPTTEDEMIPYTADHACTWATTNPPTCNRLTEDHEYCDYDTTGGLSCDAEDPEIGTCQGCGRYGYLGRTCIRSNDGTPEECGQYL